MARKAFARDKHSSFRGSSVSDEAKRFYYINTRSRNGSNRPDLERDPEAVDDCETVRFMNRRSGSLVAGDRNRTESSNLSRCCVNAID